VAQRTCALEDCNRRHCARDLCKMHYKREMTRLARLSSSLCGVSVCRLDAVKDGYCENHLYRCLDSSIEEHWRPVYGWEGLYEVSDLGRVRSLDRWVVHHDGRRVWYPSLHVGLRMGPQGYLRVLLCRNSSSKWIHVHRVVLEAFAGLRPPGLMACHGNGDPLDNSLVNLRWDTMSSNAQDSVRHGTHRHTKRTHCPRNHRLMSPNLVPARIRKGERSCLACSRAGQQLRSGRSFADSGVDLSTLADEHYRSILIAAKIIGELPAELEGELQDA
jgi:hypothetical protein